MNSLDTVNVQVATDKIAFATQRILISRKLAPYPRLAEVWHDGPVRAYKHIPEPLALELERFRHDLARHLATRAN
jgi:hypothetical protein